MGSSDPCQVSQKIIAQSYSRVVCIPSSNYNENGVGSSGGGGGGASGGFGGGDDS